MPKFVIEREIPGAGNLNTQELQAVSQTSCNVLQKLGPQIQWVQSYVTADKVYCVYIAPNEEMIREHSTLSGIPANRISEVKSVIDPTTAESEKQSAAASSKTA
jgi:hypothetical protein